MVGIASGAYSSIFIAAPLLCMWKEREPEYARRKDAVVGKAGIQEALEESEEALADEPAPALAPVADRRRCRRLSSRRSEARTAPPATARAAPWTSPLGASPSRSSARSR